jgi:hypothetical protein
LCLPIPNTKEAPDLRDLDPKVKNRKHPAMSRVMDAFANFGGLLAIYF